MYTTATTQASTPLLLVGQGLRPCPWHSLPMLPTLALNWSSGRHLFSTSSSSQLALKQLYLAVRARYGVLAPGIQLSFCSCARAHRLVMPSLPHTCTQFLTILLLRVELLCLSRRFSSSFQSSCCGCMLLLHGFCQLCQKCAEGGAVEQGRI